GVLLAAPLAHTHAQAVSDGATGFSLGAARTLAEQTAVRFAVDLIKQINLQEVQIDRPRWLVFFTPEVNLETGAGTFSSIVAKVTATALVFDTVVVAGVTTPDSRFFHMVPVSGGIEANKSFNTVNGMIEAGWTPWFQGIVPPILKSAKVGVFVQGGYKFDRDTTRTTAGSASPQPGDESSEGEDQALFRLKASVRWNPIIELPETRLRILTAADGWLDLANGRQYYRLEGTVRLALFQNNFMDFKWERGSGAPVFNRGDQFSANLTVLF
ncbi:MAG: hypothetical protein ACREMA_15715, partial [Longimicrobiales bacterium]